MELDRQMLANSIAALYGSPLQLEMSIRVSQALELTDALWELVPLVVDSGQRYDCASPADIADAAPVASMLSPEVRQKIRAEADRWSGSAALTGSPIDDVKLAALDAS